MGRQALCHSRQPNASKRAQNRHGAPANAMPPFPIAPATVQAPSLPPAADLPTPHSPCPFTQRLSLRTTRSAPHIFHGMSRSVLRTAPKISKDSPTDTYTRCAHKTVVGAPAHVASVAPKSPRILRRTAWNVSDKNTQRVSDSERVVVVSRTHLQAGLVGRYYSVGAGSLAHTSG
jgi:hypothetical protein